MLSEEIILRTLKCSNEQYPHLLVKQFPHVIKRIVELWHSPEFDPFIADLLQSNGRGGGRLDRDGFPKPVWQEIYKLAELHKRPPSR